MGRAVRSALDGDAEDRVRVIVVCHEVAPERIEALIEPAHRAKCSLVAFSDGVASPAGPKNAGLDAARAPYVALLDSDDHYEPGALLAWLELAQRHGSDVVFPPVRGDDGVLIRTPRVRPGRSRDLDIVRDRLTYQSAHRGLTARHLLEEAHLRMTSGVPVGEDLAFTARLWTVARRMDRAVGAPAYVQDSSTGQGVTGQVRPVTEELTAVARLAAEPWVAGAPAAVRRAIAVKTVRVHLLGALLRRPHAAQWAPGDAAWLRGLLHSYRALAPGVLRPFSRADRALLEGLEETMDAESLAAAVGQRLRASRRGWLLTPRLSANLDRESTLRYLAADRIQAREGR